MLKVTFNQYNPTIVRDEYTLAVLDDISRVIFKSIREAYPLSGAVCATSAPSAYKYVGSLNKGDYIYLKVEIEAKDALSWRIIHFHINIYITHLVFTASKCDRMQQSLLVRGHHKYDKPNKVNYDISQPEYLSIITSNIQLLVTETSRHLIDYILNNTNSPEVIDTDLVRQTPSGMSQLIRSPIKKKRSKSRHQGPVNPTPTQTASTPGSFYTKLIRYIKSLFDRYYCI
jgi:hypothetical protein